MKKKNPIIRFISALLLIASIIYLGGILFGPFSNRVVIKISSFKNTNPPEPVKMDGVITNYAKKMKKQLEETNN